MAKRTEMGFHVTPLYFTMSDSHTASICMVLPYSSPQAGIAALTLECHSHDNDASDVVREILNRLYQPQSRPSMSPVVNSYNPWR